MKVVWSDEAASALVALETKLAERHSAEKVAEIIDQLVRRVDRLRDHPELGESFQSMATSFASWSTTGIASFIG